MHVLVVIIGLIWLAGGAAAQAVDPVATAAVAAADDDLDEARRIAAGASDPVLDDLLTWLELRQGDAPFAAYRAFLDRRPDWPTISRLQVLAERALGDGQPAADVIAWFGARQPQTGAGALRLAEALTAAGQSDAAETILRAAWLDLGMTGAEHDALLAAFGETLAPWHGARVDAMLYRGRRADAERMLDLLEPGPRALAEARIGYSRGLSNMLPLFEAVPEALRSDPGFVQARFGWLAAKGDWTEAVDVALAQPVDALGDPAAWDNWRRILARWEMREGRAGRAYALAAEHGLQEGADFADLEWLSGYIALTYLGDPPRALAHFETAAAAVSTPISLSRMHYWIGRTHEVKGQAALAEAAFAMAANHQTAFYGLLAAERVGAALDADMALPDVAWRDAPVFGNDQVRAALMLLSAGERGQAVRFMAHLGEVLPAADLAQLGAFLTTLDAQYFTLLLGKTAAARGLVIPSIYFPLHDLAALDLPVDPALALAVARRESEFNIGIASPAGALGLMQVMPATAQEVADGLGLPYSRARLTSDWQYNARLGANYLAGLQAEFGDSPVMIAAGYNAGPSRPNAWMDERGDPRLGEMDVVDWIEHIPFRETRNYVMRVTESIPIYRARLRGEVGPVDFMDLLVGQKPLLRPVLRPEGLGAD